MPTPDTVGTPDGVELRRLERNQIKPGGTYDGVLVTDFLEFGPNGAPITFRNCRIESSIVTYSPVVLESCTMTGGLYSYNTGGTISNTLIDSTTNQAFRPGTITTAEQYTVETPWTVRNSYFRIGQGEPPAHVEAVQVLGGVGISFDNVVFDTGGPFNNSQTADFSFIGRGMRCTDCYFVGFGGYAIYSEGPDNVFVRPRFDRNSEFGLLYPDSTYKPTISDARYLDGTPASP